MTATHHECPYCGTTQNLRITGRNPWTNEIVEVICEDDFHGMDDGPCFDDLELLEQPAPELRAVDCKTPEQWAQWARERVEYEDPCGSDRGRRW